MTHNAKKALLLWSALILASSLPAAMLLGRILYSGNTLYSFLAWNLFLAWLPFLLAWLVFSKPRLALVLGPLWLLFLPNAPYIMTDLIHLRWSTVGVPVWYDALMIFAFSLTGLLLGLVSVYLMQSVVERRLGSWIGWLFVVATLLLSSFGIYVGRFLRWNSWDVFTQPESLLREIVYNLLHPDLFLRTWTVTLVLATVMGFAYLVFYSLPALAPSARRS